MKSRENSSVGKMVKKLRPLKTKTLVDQVIEAIVEATATGAFLPGDRIIEAEVARLFDVSRVPVREALRILESQGIVQNVRYRGMRLMDVSVDRLEKILKVRLSLELLAVEEIAAARDANPDILAPLEDIMARFQVAADKGDTFRVARLDTEFHRQICLLSGNDVLLRMWEPLSHQLTIIFGLSTLQLGNHEIVQEHVELLDTMRNGSAEDVSRLLKIHILDYSKAIDYEKLVEGMRQLNG